MADDTPRDQALQIVSTDEQHAESLIKAFENMPEENQKTAKQNLIQGIQERIQEIDEQLTAQVNQVIHDPKLQRLEATWNGLHYLVYKSETGPRLKLKLLVVTKKELEDDLKKAVDHDQSALFKKIYEEEYGTFGGHPFSMLVSGEEFGVSGDDVQTLEKVSHVAAASHAPFLAGASPVLFELGDDFSGLGKPRDLSKVFEIPDELRIRFNEFRDSEDSRYVALTVPRVLIRKPFDSDTNPVDRFVFDENVVGDDGGVENVDGTKHYDLAKIDHAKYVWGSAAWVLAARITHAFSVYSWTGAIRGVEGGGLVEGLPIHTFKTDEGEVAMKGPTEVAITDRRERELDVLGFIGLCHRKSSAQAAFFGGQTTQRPKIYDLPEANANAALSSRLPYILAASRFAHYLKAIVREKVGSFETADTLGRYLNRWIGNYVLGRDDAGQEMKAQYPLREARVDVTEIPGKPGAYNAVVFLRPHFQLEELTTSIRLVAELPPPA